MKVLVSVPKVIVNPSNLKDKKTGAALREQAFLLSVEGRMAGIEGRLILDTGVEPLTLGTYEVSGDAFQPGQYGAINFRVQHRYLTPIAAPVSKAA